MSSPQMFKFHERCELVFGRNYIEVQVTAVRWLEGYLTVHVDPICGAFVSWMPLDVVVAKTKGGTDDHPDSIYSIVAYANNIREVRVQYPSDAWFDMRLREFPTATALAPFLIPVPDGQGGEGGNSERRVGEVSSEAKAALQEVVIVGVDGIPHPGLIFPSGGADAFIASLAEEAQVKLSKSEGPIPSSSYTTTAMKPKRVITYKLLRDALPELPPETEEPHPATLCFPPCPRCVLLHDVASDSVGVSASAAEYSPSTAQSSPQYISLGNKRMSPVPKLPARQVSRTSMIKRSLSRLFAFDDEFSQEELEEQARYLDLFTKRVQLKTLQRYFVAWRVHTYRQNKLDIAMRALVKTIPSIVPPPPPPPPSLTHAPVGSSLAAAPSTSPTTSLHASLYYEGYYEGNDTPRSPDITSLGESSLGGSSISSATTPVTSPEHRRHRRAGGSVGNGSTSAPPTHARARAPFESVTMSLLGQQLANPQEVGREGLTGIFWDALMDDKGRVRNITHAVAAVFSNGCEKSLRKEVWKFLLGHYDADMTQDGKEACDELTRQEFDAVNSQVTSILASSSDPLRAYLTEHMGNIALDVSRCDPRFWGGTEPNTEALSKGLTAFVLGHQHLGYIQGMSDVYESLFVTLGDEATTYKCFCLLMNRIGMRFNRVSEKGIQSCLLRLRQLIEYLDPELFNALRQKDADHLYFCYRWFLLDFKREFQPEDSFLIWEMIWAAQLVATRNFSVFIAYAILQMHREHIFKCTDFGQILKFFNTLDRELDARVVINNAKRALHNVQVSLAHRDDDPPEPTSPLK